MAAMDGVDRMTTLIKASVALLVLLAGSGSVSVVAAEIREGSTMTVRPDSIWFQDTAMLAHWQQLRKSRNKRALASYEKEKLGKRDAWQFIYPMSVKIVGHTPKAHQVSVEMLEEGRMKGTHWVLDSGTLMQKREAKP